MTLWLNAYLRNTENITVNIDKLRIVSPDTVELFGALPNVEGNTTVYFFEKYVETLRLFSGGIVADGDGGEIYARYRDEDESIIQDSAIVHFFEQLTPSFSLFFNPVVFQEEEVADLNCRVKNEQGGLSVGSTVHFFEKLRYDYFNSGDNTTGISVENNVSVVSEDGVLKISTSISGEKRCSYPLALTDDDDFTFECTIAKEGTPQMIALFVKNSSTATGLWLAYENSINRFNMACTGTSGRYNAIVNVGDKITIKRENGTISILHNDTIIFTKKVNFGGTYYVGHYTNKDRVQYVKNIKITKA